VPPIYLETQALYTKNVKERLKMRKKIGSYYGRRIPMDAYSTFTLFFIIRLAVPLAIMLLVGSYINSRWLAWNK
jgi:hypothetical protein